MIISVENSNILQEISSFEYFSEIVVWGGVEEKG